MKISVVTAVLNRESTIGQTIESIRDQTYANVEHIVMDGGSQDGTPAILQKFASRNMIVTSARDGGIYEGINKGILRATGDVIGLLHSDDTFASSNTLKYVANAMIDKNVDGVFGDLEYVTANAEQSIVRYWRAGEFHPDKLKWGWMPPHPTVYLRREVFERLGLYDTTFRIAADYEAMLRFLIEGQIKLTYVTNVMVRMRVRGESNASFGNVLKKSVEDYRIIRRYELGGVGTLLAKNLRKLRQFTQRDEESK